MESFTSFLRRGNSRSSILLRVYIHIYTYVSIYPYIVSSYQDFYSLAVTENLYFGVCKNRGISSVYTAIDVGEVVRVVSPFENVSAVKYIS